MSQERPKACTAIGLIMSPKFKRFVSLTMLMSAVVAFGCRTSPQAREATALKRGKALLSKADYSHALVEFTVATRAVPKDAEPQYQIGLTYLATANTRGAATAFRRALELNPKHVGAQLKLAEMMVASRSHDWLEEASSRL